MVAGEASGDALASTVIGGILNRSPDAQIGGVGGPAMQAAGFDAWYASERLSVNGYAEVIHALPDLIRLRRTLAQRLIGDPPQLFVGVDAPDFNLGLETRLRGAGIRTAHFISPSIWAWRAERIEKIRAAVNHMLVVFPFEEAIYLKAGIPVTYVGHPLADRIPLEPDRAGARAALGLAAEPTVVALLPGSRAGEIERLAPVFLQTAMLLARDHPDWQFVLPAATTRIHGRLTALCAEPAYAALAGRLHLHAGRAHEALAAANVVLVASGTATLESALFKRPMVIAYRVSPLSAWLMRDKGYLPWVGLPNILCAQSLVPEFLQEAATPAALAAALVDQLEQSRRSDTLRERFTELHMTLRCDCAGRSAKKILELAGEAR